MVFLLLVNLTQVLWVTLPCGLHYCLFLLNQKTINLCGVVIVFWGNSFAGNLFDTIAKIVGFFYKSRVCLILNFLI